MYLQGRGVPKDPERARQLVYKAVELGFVPAHEAQAKVPAGSLARYEPPRRKHLQRPPWSTAFAPGP